MSHASVIYTTRRRRVPDTLRRAAADLTRWLPLSLCDFSFRFYPARPISLAKISQPQLPIDIACHVSTAR